MNKKLITSQKKGLFSIICCVLFWGFSFISIKIAIAVFPPMSLGMLRFAIALVFLYIIKRKLAPDEKLRLKDIPVLAAAGITGVTLYFFFENNGIALISASEASIAIGSIPALIMITDWLSAKIKKRIARETSLQDARETFVAVQRLQDARETSLQDARETFVAVQRLQDAKDNSTGPQTGDSETQKPISLLKRQWLGCLVSIAGVWLVAGVSFALSGSILGYIYMTGAAFSWVTYSFITRTLFAQRSAIYIVFWQSLAGFICFIPFAAMEFKNWGEPSAEIIVHLLFLAVFCSAIGHWCYVMAMEGLSVSISGIFLNIIPVVTVVAGFLVLGERLTLLQWLGAALVVFGVCMATYKSNKQLNV